MVVHGQDLSQNNVKRMMDKEVTFEKNEDYPNKEDQLWILD